MTQSMLIGIRNTICHAKFTTKVDLLEPIPENIEDLCRSNGLHLTPPPEMDVAACLPGALHRYLSDSPTHVFICGTDSQKTVFTRHCFTEAVAKDRGVLEVDGQTLNIFDDGFGDEREPVIRAPFDNNGFVFWLDTHTDTLDLGSMTRCWLGLQQDATPIPEIPFIDVGKSPLVSEQIPAETVASIFPRDNAIIIFFLNLATPLSPAVQEIVRADIEALQTHYPGRVIVAVRYNDTWDEETRIAHHKRWQPCLGGEYIPCSVNSSTWLTEVIHRVLRTRGLDTRGLDTHIDAEAKGKRLHYALRELAKLLADGLSGIYMSRYDFQMRLTVVAALHFGVTYRINRINWDELKANINSIVDQFKAKVGSKSVKRQRRPQGLWEKLSNSFFYKAYHTTHTYYWVNVETLAEVCGVFYRLMCVLEDIESHVSKKEAAAWFVVEFEKRKISDSMRNPQNVSMIQNVLEAVWTDAFNEFHPGILGIETRIRKP